MSPAPSGLLAANRTSSTPTGVALRRDALLDAGEAVPRVAPEEWAASQKQVVNRLRRAAGQLNAVIGAIESGGRCRDVVTQMAAVSKAIDRAACLTLSTTMRRCLLADPADAGAEHLTENDLEKLFLMLT
jgi:DNA-binding FrmR family transcriptional regulator